MKKILFLILAFCFISFSKVNAESLIIPSTDTINQYLEYRSGCNSNILDCYSANGLENNAWSDVAGILNQIPKNTIDKRIADIEKARERLDKDNEANYKQLQDQLKNISSSININQSYQSIEESAQEEYEYQLQVYELKSELWCMNKEGYYSSFNKQTKACECVEGSTFINGRCENELRLRLDNLLMCVKSFGPLSYYNYEKDGCVCEDGSEFNWNNNGLCTKKEKISTENEYIPITESQNIKTVITSFPEVKTLKTPKTTKEIASKSEIMPETLVVQSQDNPTPTINQKTTFWQKFKNSILKIKFW
ncbi:MAG: hypothetical protein WA101_00310 [Minisyncoccia bacterium]